MHTTTESSHDLLAGIPLRRGNSDSAQRRLPPELAAARALCRELRRKQARPDKQRIAHLICLNLVSMLKRSAER